MSNSLYTDELTISSPNGTLVMGYDGTKARALNSTTNGTLQVAIVSDSTGSATASNQSSMITPLVNIQAAVNSEATNLGSTPSILLVGGKNPEASGGETRLRPLSVVVDNTQFVGNQNILLVGGTNTSGSGGSSTKHLKLLNVTDNGDLRVAIVSDTTSGGSVATSTNQLTMISNLNKISNSLYNHSLSITQPNGTVVMGFDGSTVKALKSTSNGTLQVAIVSDSTSGGSGATSAKQDSIISSLGNLDDTINLDSGTSKREF